MRTSGCRAVRHGGHRLMAVVVAIACAVTVAACAPPPSGPTPTVTPPPPPPPGSSLRGTQFRAFFGGSHNWEQCKLTGDAGIQGGRSTPGGEAHHKTFEVGDVLFRCGKLLTIDDSVVIVLTGPNGRVIRGRLDQALPMQLDTDGVGAWKWAAGTFKGTFTVSTASRPSAFGAGTDMVIPGFTFDLLDWDSFILSGFAPNASVELHVFRQSAPDCLECNDHPDNPNTGYYAYDSTFLVPLDGAGQGHFAEPASLGAGRFCFLFSATPPNDSSFVECEQHMFVV
jgi:hypothetical protein